MFYLQKLVLSLSTDKAVWEAIMKNEAVQELHKCLIQGIPYSLSYCFYTCLYLFGFYKMTLTEVGKFLTNTTLKFCLCFSQYQHSKGKTIS